MKLFFIGSGKMATAIAGGLVRSGTFKIGELGAFDPSQQAANSFQQSTGIKNVISVDPAAYLRLSDAVLLAVKPQVIEKALAEIKDDLKGKLLISIAAGVTIEKLRQLSGCDRIIRVMPNTPALIGRGASGYYVSSGCSEEDSGFAEKILNAAGVAVKVDSEAHLDAVTALSGSGPAYVFEFIQALADGGVAEGLSRDTALQLAIQTVLGAAAMAKETGKHPSVLKDEVTSPGGTTSRALEQLAVRGFSGTVIQAVRAAAERCRQLGGNKK